MSGGRLSNQSSTPFSCALGDNGQRQSGSVPNSQAQSLFARSAAEQNKQKNLAARVSCERTMVVDFDSSVANNNNSFLCPMGSESQSKLVSNGCLRNSAQIGSGGGGNRFGGQPSLYGTIPLIGHDSNTNAVAQSRLLFAQIAAREPKLVARAEAMSAKQLHAMVCACPINPETHVGAPETHTFAISERFCIDESNQVPTVTSGRTKHPFALPKTKTQIRSIECVRRCALLSYFKGVGKCGDLLPNSDDNDAPMHLHITTTGPHNFVPGIKFALLNSSALQLDSFCPVESVDASDNSAAALACLLSGPTPMIEVYDVIDEDHFLAVACKTAARVIDPSDCCIDVQPCGNAFESCVGVLANTMFRRSLYDHVDRNVFFCAESGEPSLFYARYECVESCRPVFAYICCALSPQQLATFANSVVESALHSHLAQHDVRQITYDALTDDFIVEIANANGTTHQLERTKNLLGGVDHYSTIALSRNAMLATASCPSAKELYLQRALCGAHLFKVEQALNDTFQVRLFVSACREIRTRTVRIEAGIYKPQELVHCLARALNRAAHADKDCFEFCVDFTLHPTDGLRAWKQCRRDKTKNYPVIGSSPYEAQTFGIKIANKHAHRFALCMPSATAATFDFEADQGNNFALVHGSRSIQQVIEAEVCNDSCKDGAPLPPCKTPKMRAFYSAKIDECTNLVTLAQAGLNPLYCNTLATDVVFNYADAMCTDGPENALELSSDEPTAASRDIGAGKVDHCEDNEDIDDCRQPIVAEILDDCDKPHLMRPIACPPVCEQTCDGSDPNDAFLAFQLPHDECNPTVLPLCASDVVWVSINGCRVIGACVKQVWRECDNKYKVALDYGARAFFTALYGTNAPEDLPTAVRACVLIEPVGFNVHMNGTPTPVPEDRREQLLTITHSAQTAVSKWLGFANARTLQGRKLYTSTSCPVSLIDARLILSIPEINNCGRKMPRYASQSPHDAGLVRHYGVLVLNRRTGTYRYDAAIDSMSGYTTSYLCGANCGPGGSCEVVGSSANTPTKCLSFHLTRSDGSAYVSCGDTLIASVELCFIN